MQNLSLEQAYAKFGAKAASTLRALSAMADDGAMVLSCASGKFTGTGEGVLRYEDTLTREPAESRSAVLLGKHLALARDGELPVRMVVVTAATAKIGRVIHVRSDLIGKVTVFDGDRFVVDFSRLSPRVRRVSPGTGRPRNS